MATWAKGLDFKNSGNTKRIGGVGVFGTDSTAQKVYLGFGTEPWNNQGLELTSSTIKFKGADLSLSNHNHDSSYFKSSGGTITGKATFNDMGNKFNPAMTLKAPNQGGGSIESFRGIEVRHTSAGGTLFGAMRGSSWDNQFVVMNTTNGATDFTETLKVGTNMFNYRGNTVWHSGNFNPDGKANSSHGHSNYAEAKASWNHGDFLWRLSNHHGLASVTVVEGGDAQGLYAWGSGLSFGGPSSTCQLYHPHNGSIYWRGKWQTDGQIGWHQLWHSGAVTPCHIYKSPEGYYGLESLEHGSEDYIRTPKPGLIPHQASGDGRGTLGTGSWPFREIHVKQIRTCDNLGVGNTNLYGQDIAIHGKRAIVGLSDGQLFVSYDDYWKVHHNLQGIKNGRQLAFWGNSAFENSLIPNANSTCNIGKSDLYIDYIYRRNERMAAYTSSHKESRAINYQASVYKNNEYLYDSIKDMKLLGLRSMSIPVATDEEGNELHDENRNPILDYSKAEKRSDFKLMLDANTIPFESAPVSETDPDNDNADPDNMIATLVGAMQHLIKDYENKIEDLTNRISELEFRGN